MKTSKLQSGYYMFGNKGTVWGNKAHIAHTGPETLCGTPMLSTNWAQIEKLEEVNCPECLAVYGKPNQEEWDTMIKSMEFQTNKTINYCTIIPERFAKYVIDYFTNTMPPIIFGKDYVLCSEPHSIDDETKKEKFTGIYTREGICYGVITTIVRFKELIEYGDC